jgi:hypothetical protein
MQMQFTEIMLEGRFIENNYNNFNSYLFREYKKAEREHYSAKEFFEGCLGAVNIWEKYITDRVASRKMEIYDMLTRARSETDDYGDLNGQSIEERRQQTVDYCLNIINNSPTHGIHGETYYANFFHITSGRIRYNMEHEEIIDIESKDKSTDKAEENKKKKAGRPKQENPLHREVYREFLRLTTTNDRLLLKAQAVHRLATITYKDKFGETPESSKSQINRIIRTLSNNN